MRDGASIIACPHTHVINLSLIHGVVPDDLKTAIVVPLFKKSDKKEVGNYRPVTILTIISKVFLMKELFISKSNHIFIRSNFIINLSRFSTDTCLTHLTDFIKFQVNQGHFVGMIC